MISKNIELKKTDFKKVKMKNNFRIKRCKK